jgi:hypothetical protein
MDRAIRGQAVAWARSAQTGAALDAAMSPCDARTDRAGSREGRGDGRDRFVPGKWHGHVRDVARVRVCG